MLYRNVTRRPLTWNYVYYWETYNFDAIRKKTPPHSSYSFWTRKLSSFFFGTKILKTFFAKFIMGTRNIPSGLRLCTTCQDYVPCELFERCDNCQAVYFCNSCAKRSLHSKCNYYDQPEHIFCSLICMETFEGCHSYYCIALLQGHIHSDVWLKNACNIYTNTKKEHHTKDEPRSC